MHQEYLEANPILCNRELSGIHKVVSFGGWGYSTSPETFHIFREGVNEDNRQAFADNMVQFLKDHNIDGLDFDWEYPGEPDIDDIPKGSPEDGGNYLEFLKLVREQLPEGKTLSVALPASYWYLKLFPVEDMGPVLDYVIYMAYDLHGQWGKLDMFPIFLLREATNT
ncbi:hypothetical protein IMZ48_05285 [Candidatus Bathyarchaeota archaeon]|nr:hypothetical protein [Candidatus Bathyarchaeota archaeon]